MKNPVRVAVTGAAGQISYAALFRIASGQMLGADQPIILQLLEVPQAMKALEGVVMELEDSSFPLIAGMECSDNPNDAFKDVNYALLIGSKPRGPGMERSDLLLENGGIFTTQGKALNDYADSNVKVVVVGNPANTNAYIAMMSAPDLDPTNFSALTRLDHNRALALLAKKTGSSIEQIKKVAIWGNHSLTQYPQLLHTTVAGKPALELVDQAWYQDEFIPRVAKRGAEIIEARGSSSAASAANAVVCHMRGWVLGTPDKDWTSMAVRSDGSYEVPENLMYSFPVVCKAGKYEIVQGLEVDAFSRSKMDHSRDELEQEKAEVSKLLS